MKTLTEERTELLESINKFEHIRESMRRQGDWIAYRDACLHLSHLAHQLEINEDKTKQGMS